MYGSVFWNCWGSLFAFTVTFAIVYQESISPLKIMLTSFFVAIAVFILMFPVRSLIGFILFTPDDEHLNDAIEKDETDGNKNLSEEMQSGIENPEEMNNHHSSSKGLQDQNAEEIANVVRAMMEEKDDA